MKLTYALIIVALNIRGFREQGITQHKEESNCQKFWKYKKLKKEFNGTILFNEQPTELCGQISVASVTLVRTESGDTLRILNFCNMKGKGTPNDFQVGEKVTIIPKNVPESKIDLVPVDRRACSLRNTYFGALRKKK